MTIQERDSGFMAATLESEAAEADQAVATIAHTVPAVLTSAPPFSQVIFNASDVPTAAPTPQPGSKLDADSQAGSNNDSRTTTESHH
jgi:hypothetical protein